MADTVNSQITDSISQANLEVVGMAPAVALGYLYQATAQALGNAANNATTAQHNGNILGQAVTSTGSALIYAMAPK